MRLLATVNKSAIPLLDEPLQKYYEKRRLAFQTLESDDLTTPRGVTFRISVMCSDKANELMVVAADEVLLRIWHFNLYSETWLMLPSGERLTLLFQEAAP